MQVINSINEMKRKHEITTGTIWVRAIIGDSSQINIHLFILLCRGNRQAWFYNALGIFVNNIAIGIDKLANKEPEPHTKQ